MAIFTGQAKKNNTFTGTAAADVFLWAAGDLDSKDRASGAGGIDTLKLTTAGALSSTALAGFSGIEKVSLAAGGNGITLKNANFVGVADAKISVIGGAGAGDNTVNASGLTGSRAIDVTAGEGKTYCAAARGPMCSVLRRPIWLAIPSRAGRAAICCC